MKSIVLLFALVFTFFMLWVAIWKILEPKKSVEEILNPIKAILTAPNTPSVQSVTYPGYNQLYEENRIYYEHFGTAVFGCLSSIAKKCLLEVPATPTKIYCAEINDRVKLNKNKCEFFYEISWDLYARGGILTKPAQTVPVSQIENTISQNLGSYTRGFFTFETIRVWDVGDQIRVGVYGVNEASIYPVGGIAL